MGKKKAKKTGNANAPKKLVATFGKKKVKVGRILKHDNATDTNVKAKRIVLAEQLKASEKPVAVTQKGLSVEDLCRRLGHYNENICREAIIGAKEVFAKHPEQIAKHLRIVFPSIGHLITNGMKNASTRTQLMALLRIIFDKSGAVFSSHFPLFSSQVLTGFTDAKPVVREFAFEILTLLMQRFPSLCAEDRDIFDKYLLQLGNGRIPLKLKAVVDSLTLFASIYGKERKERPLTANHQGLQLSFADEKCTPMPKPIIPSGVMLHFPVIYATDQQNKPGRWEELCHRVLNEKPPNGGLFWHELHKLITKMERTKKGSKT